MAIVILGGLLTATLLNLFVLPTFYLQLGRSRRESASVLGESDLKPTEHGGGQVVEEGA
jgi:hypothetical protein